MNRETWLLAVGLGLVAVASVGAQMMPPGRAMSSSRRTMITLVSPADSPTQVARGVLVIGAHGGMLGAPSMPLGAAGMPGGSPPLTLMLRLSGVTAGGRLVTSSGNHLLLDARLSTVGGEQPVSVDEPFAISNGNALVIVPVALPTGTGAAALLIDHVGLLDADANTIAVPGVAIAAPPTPRPTRTPAPPCDDDADCDDGDAATRDLCTPVGCRHMPRHMGGPMR